MKIKKIIILVFSFFCITGFANNLNIIKKNQFGQLYKKQHVYIINLHGSFYQMGEGYGELLKPQLHNFYQKIQKQLGHHFLFFHLFEDISKHRYPSNQWAMLQGMAKTSGLTIRQLVFLDQTLLFTVPAFLHHAHPGCSFLATWGKMSKTGNMIVGRNFDWVKPYVNLLSPYLLVMVLHPNNTNNSVATVGYIGWVGGLTVVNNHGLFLDINSGMDSVGPVFRFTRKSYFAQNINNLLSSNNLDQLRFKVLHTPPDAAYIVNIAGPHQAYSIEDSSRHIKDYARLRSSTSQTVYPQQVIEPNLLVATNTFRLPGWRRDFFTTAYPSSSRTQSFVRYQHLTQLAIKHKGSITATTMKWILSQGLKSGGATEYPHLTAIKNPDYTYYSIVFEPKTLGLWLRVPEHIKSPWISIPIKKLLS